MNVVWAYLTSGGEPEQVTRLEEILDGKPEAQPRDRNVAALLAGMSGG